MKLMLKYSLYSIKIRLCLTILKINNIFNSTNINNTQRYAKYCFKHL